MYQCMDEKKHIFPEPLILHENIGECHGSPAYEEREVCPICGGDCVEVEQCLMCDTWTAIDELDEGYCYTCGREIEGRYAESTSKVMEAEFNVNEAQYLVKRARTYDNSLIPRLREEWEYTANYMRGAI